MSPVSPIPTAWASAWLEIAECPRPRYGSPEWEALDEADSRKWAAVFLAAECWRWHTEPAQVAADVAAALEAEDRAVHARLRSTSADVWSALPFAFVEAPSHAELERRRNG